MSKPRLLLTGDDGYQSLGTRLLIKMLAAEFDLTVAGTVTQQSGVGGKLSIHSGFRWGKTEVDGVPAFWVEGTPVDAMELMASFDLEPFPYVVSGINWGANLGGAVFSSGTVNAAMAAVVRGAARQALALSWDLPPAFYTLNHDQAHLLVEYVAYPGQVAASLIKECLAHQLWGAAWLNINFPQQPTTAVSVTKMLADVKSIYGATPRQTGNEGVFSYAGTDRLFSNTIDPVYDVRALTDGYISLTPCHVDLVQPPVLAKLQHHRFQLAPR